MIKPEEVAGQAKRKENENIRFRSYLKNHAEEETLDRQFLELHKEIFDGYDCSKCRNCCKCTLVPSRSRIWKRMRSG